MTTTKGKSEKVPADLFAVVRRRMTIIFAGIQIALILGFVFNFRVGISVAIALTAYLIWRSIFIVLAALEAFAETTVLEITSLKGLVQALELNVTSLTKLVRFVGEGCPMIQIIEISEEREVIFDETQGKKPD